MHYLLFYEKVTDYAERQTLTLQEAHLAHLLTAVRSGALLLGGVLDSPRDGTALLLFRSDSARPVESFAETDPYVLAGVVFRWHVRGWDTVVGPTAERPRPHS